MDVFAKPKEYPGTPLSEFYRCVIRSRGFAIIVVIIGLPLFGCQTSPSRRPSTAGQHTQRSRQIASAPQIASSPLIPSSSLSSPTGSFPPRSNNHRSTIVSDGSTAPTAKKSIIELANPIRGSDERSNNPYQHESGLVTAKVQLVSQSSQNDSAGQTRHSLESKRSTESQLIAQQSPTGHKHENSSPAKTLVIAAKPFQQQAITPLNPTVSVSILVEKTLANHPDIKASEHQIQAARDRIPQANALPDPSFNNTFWPVQTQALQTAAGRVGNQMSLNQGVPWPTKRQTKVSVAEKDVRIKIAELRTMKCELTKEVKVAYYDVWLNQESLVILKTTKQGLVDLIPIIESRVRGGESKQDLLRARLAIDQIEQQISIAAKQEKLAKSKLSELTGESLSQLQDVFTVPSSEGIRKDIEKLVDTATQSNPDLAELQWHHQKSRDLVRLADLQRYPDLQFGLHWGLVSDDQEVLSGIANGRDMISFNVGTTLPIWQYKIRGAGREAKNLSSSAALKIDSKHKTVVYELTSLVASVESLHQRRKIYSDSILPKLREMLKISLTEYRGQKIAFNDLTELFLEQLLIETELIRIDAEQAQIAARLERVLGTHLVD